MSDHGGCECVWGGVYRVHFVFMGPRPPFECIARQRNALLQPWKRRRWGKKNLITALQVLATSSTCAEAAAEDPWLICASPPSPCPSSSRSQRLLPGRASGLASAVPLCDQAGRCCWMWDVASRNCSHARGSQDKSAIEGNGWMYCSAGNPRCPSPCHSAQTSSKTKQVCPALACGSLLVSLKKWHEKQKPRNTCQTSPRESIPKHCTRSIWEEKVFH